MVEVIRNYSSYSYTEISQSQDLKYSLLKRKENDIYYEVHAPVKCKDYFGEVVAAANSRANVPKIYGFKIDYQDIDTDQVAFLLTSKLSINLVNLINKLYILNNVEDMLEIPRSIIYDITIDNERCLVIKGSSFYLESPLLISFYTLLIRMLSYSEVYDCTTIYEVFSHFNTLSGTDANIIKLFNKNIDLDVFLNNIDAIIKENPITGLNDIEYERKVKELDGVGSGYELTLTYRPTIFNPNNEVTFSFTDYHNMHGIYSFVNTVTRLKAMNADLLNFGIITDEEPVGLDWAYNYLKAYKWQINT